MIRRQDLQIGDERIPITKDVLSALHFSYHPTQHYCEKDFGDVNVHIQLACGGGVEYCHIKRKYDSIVWTWEHDEILLTNIQYVHQLQQALNLIGADCGDTFPSEEVYITNVKPPQDTQLSLFDINVI